MASVAELVSLTQSYQAMLTAIAADLATLKTGVTTLKAQVQALQDQIAAGGGITAADLEPLKAMLVQHEADLEGLHASGSTP